MWTWKAYVKATAFSGEVTEKATPHAYRFADSAWKSAWIALDEEGISHSDVVKVEVLRS